MIERLIVAARYSQNAIDLFEEAVGQLFGNNRTDARCVGNLQQFGPMTAGELATRCSLTTGAVTTVVDRLEKARYARRVRDKKDRRKVFIELTDYANEILEVLYAPMGQAYGGAMRNVSVDDMRVIAQYLEFTGRMNATYSQILRNHIPAGNSSKKDRLSRAEKFVQDSNNAATQLIESWGEEPDTPPVTGKKFRQKPEKGL